MRNAFLTFTLVTALIGQTTAAFAQTDAAAANPAADLLMMQTKAESSHELRRVLDELQQMTGRQNQSAEVRRYLLRRIPGLEGEELTKPINIMAVTKIDEAMQRAQVASQILGADLNGDWEITREELKAALSVRSIQGAAEAFFSSDADDNGVLNSQEIRDAVATQAEIQMGRRGSRQDAILLFDFDDDGFLTSEELERGMKALGM